MQELSALYKPVRLYRRARTRNTRKGHAASVALLRRERLRSRVVVPYDPQTKLLYKVLDLTV